jgi:hypothetical protein
MNRDDSNGLKQSFLQRDIGRSIEKYDRLTRNLKGKFDTGEDNWPLLRRVGHERPDTKPVSLNALRRCLDVFDEADIVVVRERNGIKSDLAAFSDESAGEFESVGH